MVDYECEIDATGLNCPLPLMQAKKALASLGSGQRLHIIATDPGALKDFKSFSKQTGHQLESAREHEGKFYFLLRKA